MRIAPLAVILLFGSSLPAPAQVSVELVLDQDQYLRDESLPVKVRVINHAGQTLRLGRDNDWLAFGIESHDGGVVSKLAEVPVAGEFTLESAQVATRQVDLTPCFDVSQTGRYTVTATLKIKEWNEEFSSKPKAFEIVRGAKLWEQEFGVPGATGGAPETRKYTLQQANYHKQLKLYVRLADLSENRVFRVFPVGPLVSFSQPEAQVDKANYLHLLFQTGARSFLFNVISPDGEVILRQSYEYTQTRPTLRANDEGRIYVLGGLRRLTASDLPPSFTSNATTGRPNPDSLTSTNKPGDPAPKKDARPPNK
ncbi:MAG: hypothetical protein DME25_13255 [Verrucomicrobia bacterium]|nr:MAG: hypothetical protein DME25_13255 [Verrucomicrobiota bacterium]